jgi:hypothetical protein
MFVALQWPSLTSLLSLPCYDGALHARFIHHAARPTMCDAKSLYCNLFALVYLSPLLLAASRAARSLLSGLGMQKVFQGVFCGRNVLIFGYFFDNLTVFGYLDNLVRKFARAKYVYNFCSMGRRPLIPPVALHFVPFHFVPGHYVPVISSPDTFRPRSFCPLVISSPEPKTLVPD